MSRNLSSAAAKEFDAMVKHAYQSHGGRVRQSVLQRTKVIGDVYNFRLLNAGMAREKRSSQVVVNPMDLQHSIVAANLKNYYSAEYTDIFDQATVNFDEKQALAESIAMTIKRREDQLVIDSIKDATLQSANHIGNSVSGSKANLTVAAVLKAGEILDNASAYGQKYMLITPSMRSSLLTDARVTQSTYVDNKPLTSGELLEFAGFKFIVIETSRSEGGLPQLTSAANGGSANDYLALAYVQNAVGIAIGIDMQTEVSYIAEKTSWLTTGLFKAGAAVIDSKGVVKIACTA